MGTVTHVEAFPEARKPAFKLTIDFGPAMGVKRSSAQITRHYDAETLVGRPVVAVVNLPPRQVGKFMSGADDRLSRCGGRGRAVRPDAAVANGARLF